MEYQLLGNIISNPDICNGKAIIKGTRITVQSVMSFILAGDTEKDILLGFPRLTSADIRACKDYTSLLLENPTSIKPVKLSA